MTDNITPLPKRRKLTWLVYLPSDRQPTWIEASDFTIDDTHLLTFTNRDKIVAVFHHWDYFESAERSEEGVA